MTTFFLDASYTRTPHDSNLLQNDPTDWHVKFWPLAELGFPTGRYRAMSVAPGPTASNILHGFATPDEHLLCYDFLYFAVENRQYEWEFDFGPAWRFVGRHIHWSQRINDLAREYLGRIFGIEDPNADIPPVIVFYFILYYFLTFTNYSPSSSRFMLAAATSSRGAEKMLKSKNAYRRYLYSPAA